MEQNFIQELKSKFSNPWKHTAFKLYFWLFVVTIGGFDIYYSIYEVIGQTEPEVLEILKNMSAYAITLISASLLEISLSSQFENKASFDISAYFIAIFSVILFFVTCHSPLWLSSISALVGFLLALGIWIIANSKNLKLTDDYWKKTKPNVQGYADQSIGEAVHGTNWE